jgi:hypothetical protein
LIEVAELGVRAALSDTGIELVSSLRPGEENAVQPNANGVLAGICFRVGDIDEAKREAQALGLRIYPGFDIETPGGLRECGFDKESFGGIPFAVQEFDGDSFVAAVFGAADAG